MLGCSAKKNYLCTHKNKSVQRNGNERNLRREDMSYMKVEVLRFLGIVGIAILTLTPRSASAQEVATDVVEALVVDAETGEELPFASVTVVGGRKVSTITNAEGQFRITVEKGERLQFTYAGYKALTLTPKAVGQRVELVPATLMVRGVEVRALPLKEIRKETVRQQRKHRRKTADFFYRQTAFVDSACYEYVEAFLTGRSAVAVSDLKLSNGRYAAIMPDTTVGQVLQFYKNFFTFSQIELATNKPKLDPSADIMPLYERATKLYDIDYDILSDSASCIYVIRFQPKAHIKNNTILDCTLYVDSVNNHILRCDGSGRNFRILQKYPKSLMRKDEVLPVTFNFSINMTEENGFTEVQSVYVDTYHHQDSMLVRTKSTLFNVGLHDGRKKGKELKFEDDLHKRIEKTEYDRDFWQQNEIVRRTRVEEAVKELFERRDLFGVF